MVTPATVGAVEVTVIVYGLLIVMVSAGCGVVLAQPDQLLDALK